MHEDIASAWDALPRSGPEMVARFGWSHPTMGAARWDGQRLRVSKELPAWLDLAGWEEDHGDGTVPAIAAVPIEVSAHETTGLRVPQRHGPMAVSALIPTLLEHYEGRAPLSAVRGPELRPAAIGLDVEEMYPLGAPVPLVARLRGIEQDVGAVTVWASLRRAGQMPPVADTRLEWDEEAACFRGEAPAPEVGLFDLEVIAQAVPGVGALRVAESLAVVES